MKNYLNTIEMSYTQISWRTRDAREAATVSLRVSRVRVYFLLSVARQNNNRLLTERERRTGEYWPEVVAVRTERSEVRTATTEGQYSPVRPEQARLVSCLFYGTLSQSDSKMHFRCNQSF